MKKRKLTEAERRGREKRTLYITNLNPNDPRDVAKYLYQEFSESPSQGAWLIRNEIGRHKDDRRFLGEMLKALGDYIVKGQPPPKLKKMNFDVAAMMHEPLGAVRKLVSKLQKKHPDMSASALERAVYRSLDACWKLGQRE